MIIFQNEKGQVIKDFGKKALIWKYNNGHTAECEVVCNDLTEDEFHQMYDSMKFEKKSPSKIVEHAIIYCNCEKCLPKGHPPENYYKGLPLEVYYIPQKPINYEILDTIRGNYVVYNREKINYKAAGSMSLFQETINIFSTDFKKFTFSFEGVTFSANILILRAKLD